MNLGDMEYLICEKHNTRSWKKGDYCDECKVEQLEAENARLREELAKERERAETRGLALDAAVSSSCVLGAELAAAQATIEQMREALFDAKCRIYRLGGDNGIQVDVLSIQCNQDALHEALAKECERLAGDGHLSIEGTEWLLEEAAQHRARKEGK